jgi:hypothetical protein
MKKSLLWLLPLFFVFCPDAKAQKREPSIIKSKEIVSKALPGENRILIDEVIALVHGPERSQIFCRSDLERRGIDSRFRNLQDLVSDELIFQDALRFKVPIDDTVVKEHLNRTIRSFGLKPGEEETVFAQEGYSYQEGFDQFRTMYGVNIMIDHRIRSGLLVPEEEVIAFYTANPMIKEPTFHLQTAFLPLDKKNGMKEKGLQKDIERFIKTGKGLDIVWSDPSWLKESDIAKELDFITAMNPGDVEKIKMNNGFQLWRLNSKKPRREVPLKKRYRSIVNSLQKPLFEKRLSSYKKSLLDEATVIYNYQNNDGSLSSDSLVSTVA